MPALSASWLADRLLIHFSDGLAEAIGATDIDIEGAILDGDLIDVVGLTAAQRSALESISIRDVLMATIPDQVAFEEERFEAWCADAFEFVTKNSRHEEFEQIFSSGLNYSVILLDMLIFDSSTKEFKRILSDMTGTEFASEVKNDYPVNFLQIVPELCAISIPEALKSLSYDVTAETRKRSLSSRKYLSALRKVRRDPSFADRRGLVSFRRTGNKLEIGGDTVGPRSVDYRRQLDRAIGRVRGSLIMSRIHNRDPDLAALFEEYNDELMAETPSASAISLWVIGQDINNRVRVSQKKNSEDEGLDDNTIYYLMTFLTAHNLYLQSFPEIERLSEDLGRFTMPYQSLDAAARNAPWTLLNDLSKESGIFEIKTKMRWKKRLRPMNDQTLRRAKDWLRSG